MESQTLQVFQLSGFHSNEKTDLVNKIYSLGGSCIASQEFNPDTQFILCKKPSRSEKYLGGLITGKWLLHPKFIHDSYEAGEFLSPEIYEWSPEFQVTDNSETFTQDMLLAPQRCRNQNATQMRTFYNWRVAVVVANETRALVYKRLLRCGGAQVKDIATPISVEVLSDIVPWLTMVIVDLHSLPLVESLKEWGVTCVDPLYIGEYLLKFPPPEPEVFQEEFLKNQNSQQSSNDSSNSMLSQTVLSQSIDTHTMSNPKPRRRASRNKTSVSAQSNYEQSLASTSKRGVSDESIRDASVVNVSVKSSTSKRDNVQNASRILNSAKTLISKTNDVRSGSTTNNSGKPSTSVDSQDAFKPLAPKRRTEKQIVNTTSKQRADDFVPQTSKQRADDIAQPSTSNEPVDGLPPSNLGPQKWLLCSGKNRSFVQNDSQAQGIRNQNKRPVSQVNVVQVSQKNMCQVSQNRQSTSSVISGGQQKYPSPTKDSKSGYTPKKRISQRFLTKSASTSDVKDNVSESISNAVNDSIKLRNRVSQATNKVGNAKYIQGDKELDVLLLSQKQQRLKENAESQTRLASYMRAVETVNRQIESNKQALNKIVQNEIRAVRNSDNNSDNDTRQNLCFQDKLGTRCKSDSDVPNITVDEIRNIRTKVESDQLSQIVSDVNFYSKSKMQPRSNPQSSLSLSKQGTSATPRTTLGGTKISASTPSLNKTVKTEPFATPGLSKSFRNEVMASTPVVVGKIVVKTESTPLLTRIKTETPDSNRSNSPVFVQCIKTETPSGRIKTEHFTTPVLKTEIKTELNQSFVQKLNTSSVKSEPQSPRKFQTPSKSSKRRQRRRNSLVYVEGKSPRKITNFFKPIVIDLTETPKTETRDDSVIDLTQTTSKTVIEKDVKVTPEKSEPFDVIDLTPEDDDDFEPVKVATRGVSVKQLKFGNSESSVRKSGTAKPKRACRGDLTRTKISSEIEPIEGVAPLCDSQNSNSSSQKSNSGSQPNIENDGLSQIVSSVNFYSKSKTQRRSCTSSQNIDNISQKSVLGDGILLNGEMDKIKSNQILQTRKTRSKSEKGPHLHTQTLNKPFLHSHSVTGPDIRRTKSVPKDNVSVISVQQHMKGLSQSPQRTILTTPASSQKIHEISKNVPLSLQKTREASEKQNSPGTSTNVSTSQTEDLVKLFNQKFEYSLKSNLGQKVPESSNTQKTPETSKTTTPQKTPVPKPKTPTLSQKLSQKLECFQKSPPSQKSSPSSQKVPLLSPDSPIFISKKPTKQIVNEAQQTSNKTQDTPNTSSKVPLPQASPTLSARASPTLLPRSSQTISAPLKASPVNSQKISQDIKRAESVVFKPPATPEKTPDSSQETPILSRQSPSLSMKLSIMLTQKSPMKVAPSSLQPKLVTHQQSTLDTTQQATGSLQKPAGIRAKRPSSEKKGGVEKKIKLESATPHKLSLPWIEACSEIVTSDDSDTEENKPSPVEISDAITNIITCCLDDGLIYQGLDLIVSSLSSEKYPQPGTLHFIIHDIMLNPRRQEVSERGYYILRKVLGIHPPTNNNMQAVYMEALRRERKDASLGQEWNFICGVIGSLLNPDSTPDHRDSCFMILQFIVALLEQDYLHSIQRKKPSMLSRILWTGGVLSYGSFNGSCRQLLGYLVKTAELSIWDRQLPCMYLLQSIVAMAAETTRFTTHNPSVGECLLMGDRSLNFARELAYKVKDVGTLLEMMLILETLPLPWLTLKVCEALLDLYDDCLVSANAVDETLPICMRKIISRYLYLLPPLHYTSPVKDVPPRSSQVMMVSPVPSTGSSQSPRRSPHYKRKTEPLKTLAVGNQAEGFKRDKINTKNAKGETKLHRACIRNNVTQVKELLQHPLLDINAADNFGWTPLHEACNHGNIECIKLLLKPRPQMSIGSYFNQESKTTGRINLCCQSENGVTPLHEAVTGNHVEIVSLLLKQGGNKLKEIRDNENFRAADYAVSEEMQALFKGKLPCTNTVTKKRNSRLLALSMSQSMDMNDSMNSPMSMNSSLTLSQSESFVPDDILYREILSESSKQNFVSVEYCHRYIVIVFHLVTTYVKILQREIKGSNQTDASGNNGTSCKLLGGDSCNTDCSENTQYSETQNSSKQGNGPNEQNSSAKQKCQHRNNNNEATSSAKILAPEDDCIAVRRSRRAKKKYDKFSPDAFGSKIGAKIGSSASSVCHSDSENLSQNSLNDNRGVVHIINNNAEVVSESVISSHERLKEEWAFLKDLTPHVRGFESHLVHISNGAKLDRKIYKPKLLALECLAFIN